MYRIIISQKDFCQKNQHDSNTYGHSGNDYRVATLSILYLTFIGIISNNSNMPKINEKS